MTSTAPGPRQRTLGKPVTLSGVGLHCGAKVTLTLIPAPPRNGIVFRRVDLPGCPEIPADRHHVVAGSRGTRIKKGDAEVLTVEHLLSSAAGLGIDNLFIDLDAPEPPALDGSALRFSEALLSGGVVEQDVEKAGYRVLFPVAYQAGGAAITAAPADEFRISFTIEYPGTAIGYQSKSVAVNPDTFVNDIMKARTFCLKEEVDKLHQSGMGLGGSLDNAVVVDGDKVLNHSLNYPDEFVRHKILDLIGDLAIAGAPIRGHFIAHKTGHYHNIQLLKQLFAEGALAATGPTPPVPLDIRAIRRILPHRYPFLLVDRIEEMEVGRRAVGYKCVTINESFFQGHFPGRPVMPGVLIMEALAQVAGVTMLSRPEFRGKIPYFTGLDEVLFRRPIIPGDVVRLEVEVEKIKLNMGKVRGIARVGENVAASGVLKFSLLD